MAGGAAGCATGSADGAAEVVPGAVGALLGVPTLTAAVIVDVEEAALTDEDIAALAVDVALVVLVWTAAVGAGTGTVALALVTAGTTPLGAALAAACSAAA